DDVVQPIVEFPPHQPLIGRQRLPTNPRHDSHHHNPHRKEMFHAATLPERSQPHQMHVISRLKTFGPQNGQKMFKFSLKTIQTLITMSYMNSLRCSLISALILASSTQVGAQVGTQMPFTTL